jgi:hypothetical protein
MDTTTTNIRITLTNSNIYRQLKNHLLTNMEFYGHKNLAILNMEN